MTSPVLKLRRHCFYFLHKVTTGLDILDLFTVGLDHWSNDKFKNADGYAIDTTIFKTYMKNCFKIVAT